MKIKTVKKYHKISRDDFCASRLCAVVALFLCTLFSHQANAGHADWLAIELNTTASHSVDQENSRHVARELAQRAFDDDANISVTVTQSIRGMMDPGANVDGAGWVHSLISQQPAEASQWFAGLPKTSAMVTVNRQYYECALNTSESRVECNDPAKTSISTGTADQAPSSAQYGNLLVQQILRGGFSGPSVEVSKDHSSSNQLDIINLMPGPEGLLTVEGGRVQFIKPDISKQVKVASALEAVEWSVFVRDPSALQWDEKQKIITAKKTGDTEMFIVTPGRISIISVVVGGQVPVEKKQLAIPNKEAAKVEISTSLASLDGLDQAATRGSLSASLGRDGAPTIAAAPDLPVSDAVTKIGDDGLNSMGQIVRAKAKVNLDRIIIKIIDERSNLSGITYPVSGIRVKIAGTDFAELTNARGEVEIRDIPSGSRILLEISDDRGYLMPQITEVQAEREKQTALIQIVRARRFASLDLIARSGGVVQDMRKSSLCGVVGAGNQPSAGASVALDALANGPFYFNQLGLVDLRQSGTGADGKFCFFNVEPGPVAVSIKRTGEAGQFSGVVSLVGGRHSEETFDLKDARHVATNLTAVGSANEQLGSDIQRANRHDLVEQADMFAVGSGHLMVAVDNGVLSTGSRVLPIKGRVWTVSSSPDFETTVQPLSARLPISQQISTLIPNGFISDMAVFSQTIHDNDSGSVVVEHGHLAGHGDEIVKFRLVDAFGRDVGDGWYFSDQPVSKAVFFNVPPGVYALIVETSSGHWIAADTTIVYSESVSFVKTGSPLEKVSNLVRRNLVH